MCNPVNVTLFCQSRPRLWPDVKMSEEVFHPSCAPTVSMEAYCMVLWHLKAESVLAFTFQAPHCRLLML